MSMTLALTTPAAPWWRARCSTGSHVDQPSFSTKPRAESEHGFPPSERPYVGVDRAVPEQKAKGGIARMGGKAANHVTGIDVLEIDLRPCRFEIRQNLVSQVNADVAMAYVTGRIAFVCGLQEILASALRGDDHRMAALLQPVL